MAFTNSDIQIAINGSDYTSDIYEFEETGGEILYETIKTWGNNYTKIEIGRSEYSIGIGFKMIDSEIGSLFEASSSAEIVVSVGSSIIGSGFTTTYNNAKAVSLNILTEVDDLVAAEMQFTIPPLDETGIDNRSII